MEERQTIEKKVLVVEVDDSMRNKIDDILKNLNYKTKLTNSLNEAKAYLSTGIDNYDGCLSGGSFPDNFGEEKKFCNGIILYRHVSEIFPKIKFILMSSDPSIVGQAKKEGCENAYFKDMVEEVLKPGVF